MAQLSIRSLSYTVLASIGSCLSLPVFFIHPRGRARFVERLGSWDLPEDDYVWVHGASVGELKGIIPFISTLREVFPGKKILMTSFSVTGVETLKDHVDVARVLPLDIPLFIRRAISRANIHGFLFSETEIWPGLLSVLSEREVPIVLVNGRIEPKSLSLYKAFSFWITPLLKKIKILCVMSEVHKARYLELGVPEEKIVVTGNSKYDRDPLLLSEDEKSVLLKEIGGVRGSGEKKKVVVLASAHPTEESGWLTALKESDKRDDLLIVIAPRHLEKTEYFTERFDTLGISYTRYSDKGGEREGSVLLLDTFGELEKFYLIGDLVFVGGTLVDIGGHNVLEPAQYGVPTCIGRYSYKITDELELLESEGGVIVLGEGESELSLIQELFRENSKLSQIGEGARKACSRLSGTKERISELVTRAFQRES